MKLVKVIWRDAKTNLEPQTLSQIKEDKLAETITIGYLIDENKERIAICSYYHPISNEEEYQDGFKYVHLIPKSWIIKRIELKETKDAIQKKHR